VVKLGSRHTVFDWFNLNLIDLANAQWLRESSYSMARMRHHPADLRG
jgi:hypothetical protein